MTQTWERMEGVYLAGQYGLDQWLGSDETGAFYLTSYGPRRERAVLKLMLEDPDRAAVQILLWKEVAELNHPSLMRLLDSGRTERSGESFLYAVFEAPDDSLTAAIENGPISEAEARDVLGATLDAVKYLHRSGWAHTSIDTEHVVAVGDRIKLASDTLEPRATESSQSEDIWGLGALVYELVTRRRLHPGETADLASISEPLDTVIRRATDPSEHDRWTAAQLADYLHTSSLPKKVVPEPAVFGTPVEAEIEPVENTAVEATHEEIVAEPAELTPIAVDVWHEEATIPMAEPVEHEHPREEPEPIVPAAAAFVPEPEPKLEPSIVQRPAVVREPFTSMQNETAFQPRREAEPDLPPPANLARYIPITAIAAIVLLVAIFVLAHRGSTPAKAVAIAPPPVVAATPPARQETSADRAGVPARAPVATAPVVRSGNVKPLQTWRVVAYTYSRMKDAEKKAASINSRYKDLHAEVFTFNVHPPAYMISLGAHLTRDEAASLRKKAVGKGMPRDTFIRNFAD